jgi:OOP family OmpA-OmpF porin
MKLQKFLALAVLLTATAAHADHGISLAKRFGIGVGGGLSYPVQTRTFNDLTDHGWSAVGSLNYYFTDALGIDLSYNHLDFSTGGHTIGQSFTLGVLYRLCDTAKLTPVLGLGAGYGKTRNSDVPVFDYNSFTVNGKIGLDYAINHNWVAGIAAKYAWFKSPDNSSFNVNGLLPQLSLTYFFGKSEAAASSVVSEPAKKEVGDTDHDGVNDDVDQCPNTPSGAKVNSIGCTVTDKVELTINVQFDNGKSVVKESFRDELSKMGNLMQEHADLKAEVQGHSDNVGNAKSNEKLSAARAKAVKDYLVKNFKIDASRLTSKGYGSSKPVADNNTAEGRAQNRRVVASFK